MLSASIRPGAAAIAGRMGSMRPFHFGRMRIQAWLCKYECNYVYKTQETALICKILQNYVGKVVKIDQNT